MVIKTVNPTTIDVFLNKGWDFWGRFKVSHKNKETKCYQIVGVHFNRTTVKNIEEQIG